MQSKWLGKTLIGAVIAAGVGAYLITGPLRGAEELADTILAKQVARNIQLESIKQGRPATDPNFIISQQEIETWPAGSDPALTLTRPGAKTTVLYQDPKLNSDCIITLSNETGGDNQVNCTPRTGGLVTAGEGGGPSTLKPGGDSRKAQAQLTAYQISKALSAYSYLSRKPLTAEKFKLTQYVKDQIAAAAAAGGGKTNAIEEFAKAGSARSFWYKTPKITCTVTLSGKTGGENNIKCQ